MPMSNSRAGGLLVFGDRGRRGFRCTRTNEIAGRLDTFYQALVRDKPLPADGRWGKATLEVLLHSRSRRGSMATSPCSTRSRS